MEMKSVLTIAGSDSSGGAGIQADIKTMTMNGVYAMSVITALTAQNTTGVRSILEVDAGFVREQMEAVFEDIFPDSVKIGMIPSGKLAHTVAEALGRCSAKNVVVDPVMVSTSGATLMRNEAIEVLERELIPLASVITPNIPEAQVLTGMKIETKGDMVVAIEKMQEKYKTDILLKGGHLKEGACDLLLCRGELSWIEGKRINNPNTHGTGCTLSSAIASNLAKGYSLYDSVKLSKEYLTKALDMMLDLGKGSGPVMHNFALKE